MNENQKVNVGSDHNLISTNCQGGEMGEDQKGQKNEVQQSSTNSADDHSFVVDIKRLSQVTEKDINSNSRITRNISRKGPIRGGEKKINATMANQRNASMLLATSHTATLHGGSTLEKPTVVAMGPTEPSSIDHHVHNQITIASIAADSKRGGKRLHSMSSWFIDPRRILFFFATMSSIGTILLIYFTLTMGKLNADDNGLNR